MSIPSFSGSIYTQPKYASLTTTSKANNQAVTRDTSLSAVGNTPVPMFGAKVVQFSGETLPKAGQRGIWVTTERPPATVGGFGTVSKSIPEAIARYSDVDIRIIQPYLKPLADQDAAKQNHPDEYKTEDGRTVKFDAVSEPTNASVTLDSPMGDITFQVRQKFDPALSEEGFLIPDAKNPYGYKGNVVYSLQDNDGIFERLNDLYYDYGKVDPNKYNPAVVGKVGYDPQFKLVMLFNRAAAAVMPLLNASHQLEEPEPGEAWLNQFVGEEDFVIAHDWLTGPMLNELPEDYKAGKVFMLHNTYDTGRSVSDALYSKLNVSAEAKKRGYYSPLEAGIEAADVMIANKNYVHSIVDLGLVGKAPSVDAIRKKMAEDRVVDMHHGMTAEFSPTNNPALKYNPATDKKDYGYELLANADGLLTPKQAMQQFKNANKAALQKELGLKQDPEATVVCSTLRFDPYQKGFFLFMNAAEKFLLENPKAQLIVAQWNSAKYPQIDEWIEKINSNPTLKGRLHLPNKMFTQALMGRINAGADFSLVQSLYEPYGLTQLEGGKMGAIVIGHGVDGITGSVLDPEMNGTPEERQKWVVPDEKYGQTGIIMNPIAVPPYQAAMDKQDAAYRRLKGVYEGKTSFFQKLTDIFKKPMAKRQLNKDVPASIHDWMWAQKMLPKADQAVLDQAQQSFEEALDRAMKLSKDPDQMTQVRLNALKFVDEEHHWKRWAAQYAKAFALADKSDEATWQATA